MQVDGMKVRRLRENLGLSARELAKIVSISPSHLSLIENQRRNPMPGVVARLATALDVASADLRREL